MCRLDARRVAGCDLASIPAVISFGYNPDNNALAAEIPRFTLAWHVDIDMTPHNFRPAVGNNVGAGIRPGVGNVDYGTERQDGRIGGNNAAVGDGTFGGQSVY